MLNSTKTWQEEFDDIFGENHHKICIGKNCECHKVVKQFISDLRKRDMEGLIGMFPKECAHNEWCECLEDENMPCDCGVYSHNRLVASIKRLIKNYYEN